MWLLMIGCQFTGDSLSEPVKDVTPSPPVVALITVDTWRLDHFSPTHTPNIWKLAEQGERFSHAHSPMGLTTPAHATMLTGEPPWVHGMEANNHHGYVLRADVPVLPEMFEGWASAAFVSAYPAGPEGGIRRGWDVFDGPESGERPGSIAVERALAWLPADRPTLLWVHVYEPHGPYEGSGASERARYAEEVLRVDTALGPLLESLKQRKATIVVTSDHGEVLDEERCSYQHERSISDHVLRVPMVRWSPALQPRVLDGWVGLSDVPTLLKGEMPDSRPYWIAQSGMCEADCAEGCAPNGIAGRDTVVSDPGGRWIHRPGKGRFSQSTPKTGHQTQLDAVPQVRAPTDETTEAARSLGYITPIE
jgi:hypothetical protein